MPRVRLAATIAVAFAGLALPSTTGAATVESWAPTGALTAPRTGQVALPLRDGRLLAVGGSDGAAAIASAELFDPTTGTWSPARCPWPRRVKATRPRCSPPEGS